jgi:cbb3-type cytochrome c oxidase subunit III
MPAALLPNARASLPAATRALGLGAVAAALAVLVVAGALLGGCQQLFPHRTQGEELYRKHCADCHGLDGRGNTVRDMGQAFADLTDDNWKNGGDDTSIGNSIREGSFGLMPGFQEKLDDQQIQALVAYIRILQHQRAAGAVPR